jgi:hypothetical protein
VDLAPLQGCQLLEMLWLDPSTQLLWSSTSLPKKENLPRPLQEVYDKLILTTQT